ncbi:hypothetical protein GCM10010358_62710 [Streptomyces minutiscleroticus]|uniref:Cysteine desulfurase n=1 Tax=Streptomyces minutiscleroticus TaxID=68238 RepID=A0A918U6N7_9ACTN|nr:hypothetical protein GCM10010358_62710 [Streptomyces minutiscleroticus]
MTGWSTRPRWSGPCPAGERLPNTLNVSIDGVVGRDLLAAAPGVAASTGSACRSGVFTPSPVLTAMGMDSARALGALRLSLGRWSTPRDVATAARLLTAAVIGDAVPAAGGR